METMANFWEPWLAEERRQKRLDDRRKLQRICVHCGEPITQGRYLPLEDGSSFCELCVRSGLVWTEEG